jgi:plasmid stabilization system protein ParE
MKLPVEESEFVFCDVQDIVRYLRQRSPAAANRFVIEFRATVDFLAAMPGPEPPLRIVRTTSRHARDPSPVSVVRNPDA